MINYDKKYTGVTLVIPVAYDSDFWYQVMDIPNDAGMAAFVSTQKKSQAINEEIDNMNPALYERMSWMIRDTGSFVEPGELYAKETGCEKQHGYFIAIKIRESIQGE